MHSTGSEKNAVIKSYARPLFPVNEKCNLITQVWQNLALLHGSRSACAEPLSGDAARPRAEKIRALADLTPRTHRIDLVSSGFVRLPFWIGPLTKALAPKMLEMSG